MAPPYIHSEYTPDGLIVTTLNVTTCLEEAQGSIELYNTLFHFCVFLPLLLWPLLPSTSEILNFRVLLASSSLELIVFLLWTAYLWTDDNMRCHQLQIWVPPLLGCCFSLGLEGRKAEKLGRSLRRDDFKHAALMALLGLTTGTVVLVNYFLDLFVGESGQPCRFLLSLPISAISSIIYKPFTELAMTIFYRFTTRQIPALHWLPQNGAESEFEPGWSRQLRYALVYCACGLMFGPLVVIDGKGRCRI